MAFLLLEALGHDGAPAAALMAVGPVALVMSYAVTCGWVWHNKHLYVVKGPRQSVPSHLEAWTHDRLGRELSGPRTAACGGVEVVLSMDGSRKTYR